MCQFVNRGGKPEVFYFGGWAELGDLFSCGGEGGAAELLKEVDCVCC